MKKILFVSSGGKPNPNVGGSNKVINEIKYQLNSLEYTADFYSFQYFIRNINKNENHRIENKHFNKIGQHFYFHCKMYRKLTSSYFYLLLYFIRKQKHFQKLSRIGEYSLIHSHDIIPAAFISNEKLLLTVHNKGSVLFDIKQNLFNILYSDKTIDYFKSLEIKAINNAKVLTFPSIAAKNFFLSDIKDNFRSDCDIRVIYNGINIDYIKTRRKNFNVLKNYDIKSEDCCILLNIANHIKVKNIDKIIKAIGILNKDSDKKFLLINAGKGPETDFLYKLSLDLGLKDYIYFLGSIPNEDILDLMIVSNALIMTSEKVIYDMVVLEALASDLPLLLSKVGGNLEILEEGGNGLFFENLNPECIAETVKQFIRSRLFSKNINKHKLVSSREMVNNYIELYNEIIKKKL